MQNYLIIFTWKKSTDLKKLYTGESVNEQKV